MNSTPRATCSASRRDGICEVSWISAGREARLGSRARPRSRSTRRCGGPGAEHAEDPAGRVRLHRVAQGEAKGRRESQRRAGRRLESRAVVDVAGVPKRARTSAATSAVTNCGWGPIPSSMAAHPTSGRRPAGARDGRRRRDSPGRGPTVRCHDVKRPGGESSVGQPTRFTPAAARQRFMDSSAWFARVGSGPPRRTPMPAAPSCPGLIPPLELMPFFTSRSRSPTIVEAQEVR